MCRSEVVWRRATARVLCAVLLLTALTSAVHARESLDEAGDTPLFVLHDASAHTVGAPTGTVDEPPVHCLACQWARSFRPRISASYLAAPAADPGTLLPAGITPLTWTSPASQPPLRSPPFSL